MKYIHGTEDFTLDKDSAVTLGKFDGVHMGHQKLITFGLRILIHVCPPLLDKCVVHKRTGE